MLEEDGGDLVFVLDAAVVLKGEDYWRVLGVRLAETTDG